MGTDEVRGEMWKKWEQDEKEGKLKAGDAVWGLSPGYDLIPANSLRNAGRKRRELSGS